MMRILVFIAAIASVVLTATADRRGLFSVSDSPVVIPTPIYRLELNEGSGLSMADSSGNGNTFTNRGATWIAGKSGSGGALQFDAANTNLAKSVNTITIAANTTNWTWCAWVWWDAFANDDDMLVELGANASSSGSDGAFLISPNSSSPANVASFTVQDSSAGSLYRIETTARWPAAEWVHIAAVFESAANSLKGEWTIYTNGVVATQSVNTESKDQASQLRTAVTHNLMSRNGTSLFASGRLDDVGLWGSALDSTTINAIKNEAR